MRTYSLLILLLLLVVGCQEERITRDQWEQLYKPETIEQAEAMAVLTTAKTKAESEAETLRIMNKFKIACAIGFVGAVVALGVGLWLRMKLVVGLGIVGVMACLAGYSLACADIVYGKHVAVGGLIFGVVIGAITIFIIVKALIEIIKGNEVFKKNTSGQVLDVFRDAQRGLQNSLTEVIVTKEQNKLRKKRLKRGRRG